MKYLLLLVVLTACASREPAPPSCASRLRAVIDMGSGSTKITMAEVDVCESSPRLKNKIPLEESRAVALEAAKDSAGRIPPEARAKAIAALTELRGAALNKARELKAETLELAVVATHAFRTCSNQDEFAAEIAAAGFSVRSLSQDEEARASFEAVRRAPLPETCAVDRLLVWDVGGGSAQFSRAAAPETKVVKIASGAEDFRKLGLPLKRRTACDVADSPNPLGKNLNVLRKKTAQVARIRPADLDVKNACVIGVSGVHTKAVLAQIQKHWERISSCACGKNACAAETAAYTKKQVSCLASFLAEKSSCDEEIRGPFANTAVTNLAMVLGFMDQLGIERVDTRSLNMGDYFVLDQGLLNFREIPLR